MRRTRTGLHHRLACCRRLCPGRPRHALRRSDFSRRRATCHQSGIGRRCQPATVGWPKPAGRQGRSHLTRLRGPQIRRAQKTALNHATCHRSNPLKPNWTRRPKPATMATSHQSRNNHCIHRSKFCKLSVLRIRMLSERPSSYQLLIASSNIYRIL